MYTSFPPAVVVEREPTMVELTLQGAPHHFQSQRPMGPAPPVAANRGKVNAYLSDVFELPKLKDHMKQYNLVMENLDKQRKWNETSCKKDMKYHKARYEHIYESARASPTLGPVKGLTTSPWPSTKSVDHPLTNDNIYIDAKRKKTGDRSNFLAPWRVLKEEFPPKSNTNLSGLRRVEQARSGKKSSTRRISVTLTNKPTPEQLERARTLVAPFLEPKTTNSLYGSTHNSTLLGGTNEISVSPRRYKAQLSEDWKTEAWRRANKEYRAYREATQLSGIPVNKRVSNFIFGGGVVLA